MPNPLLQSLNAVSGTVIASSPPMATRRMKKLTATGVTDSRIFLLTTTTSAQSAVMTKAATIQAAYVLVAAPPRLAASLSPRRYTPANEDPCAGRRVEGT